jgi:23S rRNA (cytidine1920-2'-O)/16S rRNA (cytidine1409-2'-O)-methyltransferase
VAFAQRRYGSDIASRHRLDTELVRRNLASDQDHARQLIDGRGVQVNGAFADKASRLVERGDSIELAGEAPRFVSRGGDKLAHALDVFGVVAAGRRALDAGASTGGFTQCLLQEGANHVVALDVGHNQLHESLVGHPQVTNLERTNIRRVTPEAIGGAVDLIVGDLSFISLRTVLDALVGVATSGGDIVLLVKPQFEATKQEASKGRGVIVDPEVWLRVLDEVATAAGIAGAPAQAGTVSPIRGGQGNVEFLYHLVVGEGDSVVDTAALVASVEPKR